MGSKKGQGKTDYSVSPEEFIQAWQSSSSAQEVADKLKMPKPIVLARASTYRKAGVHIKKMPRVSNRRLDVAALNRLIEKLDRKKGTGKE